eukprot:8072965-Pyramimonas_sp.AAC.1
MCGRAQRRAFERGCAAAAPGGPRPPASRLLFLAAARALVRPAFGPPRSGPVSVLGRSRLP